MEKAPVKPAELAAAQCRENILAILRQYGLPEVEIVGEPACDRITAEVPDGFASKLNNLEQEGYFRSWNHVKNHGPTAARGWRENVHRCSLQAIYHTTGIWEFDIDLWNPDYGVFPAAMHLFAEVWKRGKTDPHKVMAGLAKRGITVAPAVLHEPAEDTSPEVRAVGKSPEVPELPS